MRCLACDCVLSDREATRRFEESGEFVDLCDDCFETIAEDVEVYEQFVEDTEEPIEEP